MSQSGESDSLDLRDQEERRVLISAMVAAWQHNNQLTRHPDASVRAAAARRAEIIDRLAVRWWGAEWTD